MLSTRAPKNRHLFTKRRIVSRLGWCGMILLALTAAGIAVASLNTQARALADTRMTISQLEGMINGTIMPCEDAMPDGRRVCVQVTLKEKIIRIPNTEMKK